MFRWTEEGPSSSSGLEGHHIQTRGKRRCRKESERRNCFSLSNSLSRHVTFQHSHISAPPRGRFYQQGWVKCQSRAASHQRGHQHDRGPVSAFSAPYWGFVAQLTQRLGGVIHTPEKVSVGEKRKDEHCAGEPLVVCSRSLNLLNSWCRRDLPVSALASHGSLAFKARPNAKCPLCFQSRGQGQRASGPRAKLLLATIHCCLHAVSWTGVSAAGMSPKEVDSCVSESRRKVAVRETAAPQDRADQTAPKCTRVTLSVHHPSTNRIEHAGAFHPCHCAVKSGRETFSIAMLL